MTGIVISSAPERTDIYTDSVFRDAGGGSVKNGPKVVPIPHLGACFVITGSAWIGAHVVASILTVNAPPDLADLPTWVGEQLSGYTDEWLRKMAVRHPEYEPTALSFHLATKSSFWVYTQGGDFRPIELGHGILANPPINDDDTCWRPQMHITSDATALDAIRRMSEVYGRGHLGGPCIRYSITDGAMEIVDLGTAETEPSGAYRRITDPDNAPRQGDAAAAPPRPQRGRAKPGRNDPCPCKSGRKAKKCCGA